MARLRYITITVDEDVAEVLPAGQELHGVKVLNSFWNEPASLGAW